MSAWDRGSSTQGSSQGVNMHHVVRFDSMRYFAATALGGYGALDEGTMMMFGGAIKCLLNEIGFEVS